jgi:hypothetical protein
MPRMLGADVPTCGPGSGMRGAVWGMGWRAIGPGRRGAPPGMAGWRAMRGAAAVGIFGTPRALTGRASGADRGTLADAVVRLGTAGVRAAGVFGAAREGEAFARAVVD